MTLDRDGATVAREMLHSDAEAIERRLRGCLPEVDPRAQHLLAAMEHSIMGGKRLRGALVMRSAVTFGGEAEQVMPAACAFEMLHAATLIHDDLPCIDDSDLRRGRASAHVAFDEHTALLAGDALIIASFENLANQADLTGSASAVRVIGEFASATGGAGLIGGEQADIVGESLEPDLELLRYIHINKTARLICMACRAGAILVGASEEMTDRISGYGMALGLLFQITDDILDVVGDEEVLGKPTGADADAGKQTYPDLIGIDGAREEARRLADSATETAEQLPGQQEFWRSLPELVVGRDR